MQDLGLLFTSQLVPLKHILGTKEYKRPIQQCFPEIDLYFAFCHLATLRPRGIRFSYVIHLLYPTRIGKIMALPGRCGYSSAPVTTGDSHSCGVTTAFEPIVDSIIASTALYWAVVIWFFDRAVQKTGRTMHTAIVIALSQILLVDFSYWIVGRRVGTPDQVEAALRVAHARMEVEVEPA